MNQTSKQHNYEQFLMKNYQLCPIHSQRLSLLRIDNYQSGNLLKCLDCLIEKPFKCVPLIKILESDFNTILKGWPIFDDSQIYDQLKDMKQKEDFIMQDIQTVLNFYESLKKEIILLIQKEEKETIKNLQTRYENLEYPLDLYNKISQKEKLKDIIFNSYQNQDKQNYEFQKIVKENLQNQENYKGQIFYSFNNLNRSTFTYEELFSVKDKIIQLMDSISIAQSQIKIDSLQKLNQIYGQTIIDIGLQSKNIQNDGLQQIAQTLEKHSRITNLTLNLRENDIQVQGAKLIASALHKLSNITSMTLDFTENNIQTEGAKEIALSLQKLQKITNLNLNLCGNDIQDEGAKYISLALQKCHKISNLALWLE
ncbi:hypothetical protein ABPG74_019874 [Tetrahymena malaccensis]